MTFTGRPPVFCSFCAKGEREVLDLIGGVRNGAYVCNECVHACTAIVQAAQAHRERQRQEPTWPCAPHSSGHPGGCPEHQRIAVLETQMETVMSDLSNLQDTAKRLVDENIQALADMDEARATMADATARLKTAADANDIVTIREITQELADASTKMHSGAQALHDSSRKFQSLNDQAHDTDAPPADTLTGGQGDDTVFGSLGNDTLFGGQSGADTIDGSNPVNGGLDGVTDTNSGVTRTTTDASTGADPATTTSIPNNSAADPTTSPADIAGGHAVNDPQGITPDAGSPAISPDLDRTTADLDAQTQNDAAPLHPLDHDTVR